MIFFQPFLFLHMWHQATFFGLGISLAIMHWTDSVSTLLSSVTGAPEDLMFILHESFLWTSSSLVPRTECPLAVQAYHMSSCGTDVLQIQKKPILPFLRSLHGANQMAVNADNQEINFLHWGLHPGNFGLCNLDAFWIKLTWKLCCSSNPN